MKSNWKEIILYPAISAIVFTGILVFGNWSRGTLDTVWFYVIMAFAFFAIMAIGKYFLTRKKK